MKLLVQRVLKAGVTVDGRITAAIGPGLLVLIGVARGDTSIDAAYLARKVAQLRVFEDEQGNIYLWTTTAKDWPEGTKHRIRGTVKSHNLYHNIHQTVLTRVAEVR